MKYRIETFNGSFVEVTEHVFYLFKRNNDSDSFVIDKNRAGDFSLRRANEYERRLRELQKI